MAAPGCRLVALAALVAALPGRAAAEMAAVDQPSDEPRPRARREWVEVGHGIRFGMGNGAIDVGPGTPALVYVGTDTGFMFRSLDGGVTWDETRLLPDDIPLVDVPLMNPWAIPFPNDGLIDPYVAGVPAGAYSPDAMRSSGGGGYNPFSRESGSVLTGTFSIPRSVTTFTSESESDLTSSYALGGSGARVETEDPGNLMAVYFRGVGVQAGNVNWISICPSDPRVAFAATNFGAFRTRDSGITWDRVFIGTSDGENQVRCVTCHPENARVVYLGTAEGMRTSVDGGDSWVRATGNFGVWPVSFVETHPVDRRRLVVGTDLGAYETITGDEFTEVYLADTPAPEVRIVTIVRPTTDEDVTYVGTYDGAAYTHDGGRTWHRMGEFLIGHYRVRSIMVDPADPLHVYVATDWHVFESEDGGESLVELWPAYTGIKYALLDPADPGDIWLVGYSQVWRYEEPRTAPRAGPSPMTLRARRALARDPGPYAVEDEALRRARLDGASVVDYRRSIRRAALVPTLDVVGWGSVATGDLDAGGTLRPGNYSPYYTMPCRRRLVPNVCDWASPVLPGPVTDSWQTPYFGVLFVLSWPFGRSVMDERATGRIWRDVMTMRDLVMYTVYDYWTDRRRLLEQLASGEASAAEERAYSLRLEEMSAVLDSMTGGILGGPFGEIEEWEVD